ncbi:hypothetical protein AJ78_08470 [Emergomyces pasteurianus Ep9510]|uniref:Vacuolar protein sorting-associated protein 62 n=1 Tax=Emergomyces pasteurianus Ep9510 TaxID=1447872 RepID=A0A1J9P306_9EURO|nr:hypothetical protein AJ78_08470 [Emergomyces pasteurianus Ep9510]
MDFPVYPTSAITHCQQGSNDQSQCDRSSSTLTPNSTPGGGLPLSRRVSSIHPFYLANVPRYLALGEWTRHEFHNADSCVSELALRPALDHGVQLPLLPLTLSTSSIHQHPALASASPVSHIKIPDELRGPSSDDEEEEGGGGSQTIVAQNQLLSDIALESKSPESETGASYRRPANVAHGNIPDSESALISQLPSDLWRQSDHSIYQQMRARTRATITILSSLIAYVSINSLARALNPSAFIWYDEDREENRWVASSNSWWDRKACRWLSLCGVAHFRGVKGRFGYRKPVQDGQLPLTHGGKQEEWESYWTSGNETRPEDWTNDESRLRIIPDYVLEYAPLVHLFSGEQFWPGDIAEHLYHITPQLNYTPIQAGAEHPTLTDLDRLNMWQNGKYVFLTSNDNVEDRPPWLEAQKNIPKPEDTEDEVEWDSGVHDVQGDVALDDMEDWYDVGDGSHHVRADKFHTDSHPRPIPAATVQEEDFGDDGAAALLDKRGTQDQMNNKPGRSKAPAVLIVVDKGNSVVDAFWFYFYSFNLGNLVLNVRFGNHVGDWEHSLVRFHNGKPKAIFFSEHSSGEAYTYDAVEKIGKRPVIYSARGTHAMYPTPGTHAYVLPWGLLKDKTDRGPLWDPARNYHAYTYDHDNDTIRAANLTPHSPTEWFYFAGHWGDKFYPLGDARQYRFAGQYHYVNGPLGPRFKDLGRQKICGGAPTDPCVIRKWIGAGMRPKRWVNVGEGEMMGEQDMVRFFGMNGTTEL